MGPPSPTINSTTCNESIPFSTKDIIDQYPDVFQGTGLLKDFELQLHIDPDITPIQQPLRRIPFHTRRKVETELERLLNLDIIEPVSGPTSWLNPVVPVPKADGSIRLCLDMRKANTAIRRERHVIPKMEEIVQDLHGAKYFTKIDLREGYHQLKLHQNSRDITTFATHKGVFRYKRLIYGVNSAFESFQKQVEQVLADCPGARNISDDILIWGRTLEELIERLRTVLMKFQALGLKINLKKCKFATQSLTFAGHRISADGISVDNTKIIAIQAVSRPTNLSELRSFLGMITYSHQYIQNYSTIAAPLRKLTKKDEPFIWGPEQETTFTILKSKIVEAPVMAFYNPIAKTHLVVDASPVGLGAILSQEQEDGFFKPIAYGSRSLTDTETRYSQTEREALAVLWSCQHFHYYVYDRHVTIHTDHKPLLKLLTLKAMAPPRIMRWILHLQAYNFDLIYIPGCTNAADYLSRYVSNPNPHSSDHQAEEYITMTLNHAVPKDVNINDIVTATNQDLTIQKVITCLNANKWTKDTDTKPFFPLRTQLTVKDHILMKHHQIVVPSTLRSRILDTAHKHHQGMSKTIALLREKVWWPGMSRDVTEIIKNCHPCQVVTPSTAKCEPLLMTEIPTRPWEIVATDLKGPFPSGEHILVIIDYHSRYPVIAVLNDITSASVIQAFKEIFSISGYLNRTNFRADLISRGQKNRISRGFNFANLVFSKISRGFNFANSGILKISGGSFLERNVGRIEPARANKRKRIKKAVQQPTGSKDIRHTFNFANLLFLKISRGFNFAI